MPLFLPKRKKKSLRWGINSSALWAIGIDLKSTQSIGHQSVRRVFGKRSAKTIAKLSSHLWTIYPSSDLFQKLDCSLKPIYSAFLQKQTLQIREKLRVCFQTKHLSNSAGGNWDDGGRQHWIFSHPLCRPSGHSQPSTPFSGSLKPTDDCLFSSKITQESHLLYGHKG